MIRYDVLSFHCLETFSVLQNQCNVNVYEGIVKYRVILTISISSTVCISLKNVLNIIVILVYENKLSNATLAHHFIEM